MSFKKWVATLVKQPLIADEWEAFTTFDQDHESHAHISMTNALQHLFQEPHLFGGSVSDEVAPFLERILATQRLSEEANALLQTLSVAPIPLAKPALQVLCPQGVRPLKELRRACVLVAYPDRAQLLPLVAAAMYRQLTSEQIRDQKRHLIGAYTAWMQAETFHEGEEGKLVAQYALLLLKHERLLDAAQLLIDVGWLSLNVGYGPRLAQLVAELMRQSEWRMTIEQECGGLLLHSFLVSFTKEPVAESQLVTNHQYILEAILAGKLTVWPWVETYVVHYLMGLAIRQERFVEAQALPDVHRQRLEMRYPADTNARIFLLEKYGLFFCKRGEYAHVQGEMENAKALRLQAIEIYRQCIAFLTEQSQASSAKDFKWRLARCLNELGYHLNYLVKLLLTHP